MEPKDAAYYAATLDEVSIQMLLRANTKHWTRTEMSVDHMKHPFTTTRAVAKNLEGMNLVECQQGRVGNRFDNLIIRLNERGEFLKKFILANPQATEG